MRFNQQKLFEYNTEFITSADLSMVFSLQREWYKSHCPVIQYKELAREGSSRMPTDVDKLWMEPVDGIHKFERILSMRALTTFQANAWTHSKFGMENIRKDTFMFGLSLLKESDVFPDVGDQIIFNGVAYLIVNVVLNPDDHWAMTNIPLHVRCETEKFRYGRNTIPKALITDTVQ